MILRIAVAVSNQEQEEKLISNLIGISMVMKVEFDISLYSDCFDKLIDNIEKLDIVIADFDVLDQNENRLGELYERNGYCLPILIGSAPDKLNKYLILRPIQYIENIDEISPEDEHDSVKKVCELFIRLVNKRLETKTDNSVLYITTKQGSYAIPKDSILYCQSDLKYTIFVVDDGLIIRKLEKLQDVQDKYLWDFKRVHQSFLVNPKKVKNIDKTNNEIILIDDTCIPFSRKYSDEVKNLFKN